MSVNGAIALLNGVSSTGASVYIRVINAIDFAIESYFTTSGGGSITALILDLEGSLSGSRWFQMGQHTYTSAELTAKEAMFHVSLIRYADYVRLNLTTLTSSGSVAVYASINYKGRRNFVS